MDAIKRDAISRARLFISLANECTVTERNKHEAFLEAAIIFGRTAIHRTKTKYEKSRGWHQWWNQLAQNSSVKFLRDERDFILKKASPKVSQEVGVGIQFDRAADHYYYESPGVRAVDTVEYHINETDRVVQEAGRQFGSQPSS
jgi:hypothetical protein